MPSEGCSFHDDGKRAGRLMLVFQSTAVVKSMPKNCVSVSAGLSGSTIVCVPLASLILSRIEKLLFQFQRPMRSGVLIRTSVWRLWARSVSKGMTVSPGIGGSGTVEVRWPNARLFVTVKLGDQVMPSVMSIGTGDNEITGRVCVTEPLVRSCRRLPPTVSVPQSNRFEKLMLLPNVAVARNGSTAFRSSTRALVA